MAQTMVPAPDDSASPVLREFIRAEVATQDGLVHQDLPSRAMFEEGYPAGGVWS